MRLLALDFESTGLNVKEDRVIECGAVLWCSQTARPLVTVGVFLHDETYLPLDAKITEITGIDEQTLREFRQPPKEHFEWLEHFAKTSGVSLLVGHNLRGFDLPLLFAELDRNQVEAPTLRSLPTIDTKCDLGVEMDSYKLKYMAADHGFLNSFSHRAVFDCLTCLKILSQYDLEKVLANSQKKRIKVRAVVGYDQRQLAKDKKYWWDGDNKQWRKEIFADELEKEKAACPFEVGVVPSE